MKKFLSLLLLSIVLFSCKKESNPVAKCTGGIQLFNNSDYPYQISVNGKAVMNLDGKKSTVITEESGYYTVRVLQVNGYVLYPTDKTYSGNVICNNNLVISFP
jgi:hypothetical protein